MTMRLCGTPIWDHELTVNTTNPDLTPCFQRTILQWLPCFCLAFISPFYLRRLSHSPQAVIPWNWFNITKIALCVVIATCMVAELGQTIEELTHTSVPQENLISPLIVFVTMMICLFIIYTERQRGIRASGWLAVFWTFLAIFGIITFRSHIRTIVLAEEGVQIDMLRVVIFYIYYIAVAVQFVLSMFLVDKAPISWSPLGSNPNPELQSSVASRMTFWWQTGLVVLGYKRALTDKDLHSLNECDKSEVIYSRLECHMENELRRIQCGKYTRKERRNYAKRDLNGEAMPLKETPCVVQVTGKRPSLVKVLWYTFYSTFFASLFYKVIQDILLFVNPQLLKLTIHFVRDPSQPMWRGYIYAVGMLLASIVQSLVLGQYFYHAMNMGMRCRSGIIAAVYRKALRLSNSARKSSTVGEIVNLMSVDAQKFFEVMPYLHMLWSAPFQISICLFFLWQTLGPSVLAGLGVMILLIPVNALTASKVKQYQTKQMKLKDDRIKLINEVLNGIKVLKLYAWEKPFEERVLEVRRKELRLLKHAAYLNAVVSFTWMLAPFMVSLTTFAVYVLVSDKNILDAEKAFVSLSLFNILRFPISMLPQLIGVLVQVSVSVKRLQTFFGHDELDTSTVSHDAATEQAVTIQNGSFSWDNDSDLVLNNLNVAIKKGSLVAIVGKVGAGKSSMISAMLGEMEKVSGDVNVNGSVAYVSQQAWIRNATLRDNILFSKPIDPPKYDCVLEACALKPDLEILTAGDLTEIGEKGINLSGGQKQRVSMARAVYSGADIYLLDDPLSAVDAHVGKHIFDQVIGPDGVLADKTRIIVTHGIRFLPVCDQIIVLADGEISECGSYNELISNNQAFAEFLKNYLVEDEDDDVDPEGNSEGRADVTLKEEILSQIGSLLCEKDRTDLQRQISRHHTVSESSSNPNVSDRTTSPHRCDGKKSPLIKSEPPEWKKTDEKDILIQKEVAETGRVKLAVVMVYLRAVGLPITVAVLIVYALNNAAGIGANVWLSAWSDDFAKYNGTISTQQRDLRLGVYGAFAVFMGVGAIFGSILLRWSNLRASGKLHKGLFVTVMSSPMSYFDTTPVGRITNRLGKDIDAVDMLLPVSLTSFLNCFFRVLGTVVVIGASTPIFLATLFPLVFFYVLVQRFYVATSRQLKRLDGVTRSPIYSHFGETVTGVATIRAFGQEERFIQQSDDNVDTNQRTFYPSIICNRWLAVRLELVGNCIIFFAALFAILNRDSLSPGIVGLSITYALNVTQTLNWMVRMTSDLENNIVAVERIKEYSDTPSEAAWDIESTRPRESWPEHGAVSFQDYSTRYREGLDLVVKDISCDINPGEKVGIVGRTGAGKSSLTLALFRIIEPVSGTIIIDGVDISKIGLHDLRSKLTIIPQDPVLFAGTLRQNLDPFSESSDEEIWRALEYSHLKTFVSSLSLGLEYECTEGGDNLSVGQRQLVCLARALLRKTKILVLDEATAAVDLETDDLIQGTIRTTFAECTVITIAHRLNTIMDYNRIMVLEAGKLCEYAPPQELLQNPQSLFYSMAKDAGLAS